MSSSESKEQGRSGRRGAEAPREEGAGQQPRQGSQRTDAEGEGEPKHSFAPGRAPSEQGEEGSPGPESIKRRQQGVSGAGTGQSGAAAGGDRSQEEAHEGAPQAEHTREGRQQLPGDREPR